MAHPHPLYLRLKRAGISPTELSRRTGYSKAQVSRVLNGRQEPTPLFRALVADELGVDEADLFGTDLTEGAA